MSFAGMAKRLGVGFRHGTQCISPRHRSPAESFIITAGAGMGVDSGLPDFRGKEGFWKAYPPFGNWDFLYFSQSSMV